MGNKDLLMMPGTFMASSKPFRLLSYVCERSPHIYEDDLLRNIIIISLLWRISGCSMLDVDVVGDLCSDVLIPLEHAFRSLLMSVLPS